MNFDDKQKLEQSFKEGIDKKGGKALKIDETLCKDWRDLRNKTKLNLGQIIGGALTDKSKFESHWKRVKHYVVHFYGDQEKYEIPSDWEDRFITSRSLAVREVRYREARHKGYSAFLSVITHKDFKSAGDNSKVIPAFTLIYLPDLSRKALVAPKSDTKSTDKHLHKKDIDVMLTEAIDHFSGSNVPLELSQKMITYAEDELTKLTQEKGTVDGLLDTDFTKHNVEVWRHAVRRAILTRGNWLLRGASDVKKVFKVCHKAEKHLGWEDAKCQRYAMRFIQSVEPGWRPNRFGLDTWNTSDKYHDILRGMEVAISAKYYRMNAVARFFWKMGFHIKSLFN